MSETDDAESAAHFTRRFESFTDVVFGFSLSFLASRLIVPEHARDVFSHPGGIAGFLLSFAFMAALWLLNHRMFRYYFAPFPIDMTLVFVELCGVALIPYALGLALSFPDEVDGWLLYSLVYAAILGSTAIVGLRGFGRNWPKWDVEERVKRWRVPLVQAIVAAILGLTGAAMAWGVPHAELISFAIPVAAAIARRAVRKPPPFARG